jgi:transaldolase
MTQNLILSALSAAGVSVWLDDLSRDRLTSGNLRQLIDTRSVVGVTTNPSIFQHAISHGHAYTRQLTQLAESGTDADSAIRTVITDDVRQACDVLRPQWEASRGVDGRVSIEVDPRLAHDTEATVSQAAELWKIVDRPNLFVKIPATTAGMSSALRSTVQCNTTYSIPGCSAMPTGSGVGRPLPRGMALLTAGSTNDEWSKDKREGGGPGNM